MPHRFNRNRIALTKLIYSKTEPFTTEEIAREFSKVQKGDINIDGSQTIAKYLEELTEYRALTFQKGKYEVIRRT